MPPKALIGGKVLEIQVYSTPSCPGCTKTKAHLERLGLDYQDINIQDDHDSRERILSMGFLQVPVVEAHGDIWSGYVPERLDALAQKNSK